VKYARATQITISIKKTANGISMVTCDNGQGFDLKTPRKGIGLTNMQTRVEAFKGSFKINTAPGKGCYINIMLPLKDAC
jgi:signal transduction histidine kinase